MSEDSANLISRLEAGDPAAEEYFQDTFGRLVYRMTLARLRDVEAARDISQEALMATIVAIRNGTIRNQDNLGGFVYGTARHLIQTWIRRRNQENRLNDAVLKPGLSIPAMPDPDAESRAERALAAIRRLSPLDQQILQLSLVEGVTSAEIGRRLGLTAEAVRKHKSRAVDKLRARLRISSRPAAWRY